MVRWHMDSVELSICHRTILTIVVTSLLFVCNCICFYCRHLLWIYFWDWVVWTCKPEVNYSVGSFLLVFLCMFKYNMETFHLSLYSCLVLFHFHVIIIISSFHFKKKGVFAILSSFCFFVIFRFAQGFDLPSGFIFLHFHIHAFVTCVCVCVSVCKCSGCICTIMDALLRLQLKFLL